MSTLTSDSVLAQLRGVKYPGYTRDIVSFGMVKDVQIEGTRVTVHIAQRLPSRAGGQLTQSRLRVLDLRAVRDRYPPARRYCGLLRAGGSFHRLLSRVREQAPRACQ